MQAAYF